MSKLIGKETRFDMGDLRVIMGVYEDGPSTSPGSTESKVLLRWDGVDLADETTLPKAIVYAFNAVINCKIELHDLLKKEGVRTEIVKTLMRLGKYLGIDRLDKEMNPVQSRVEPSADVRQLFKSWDDIPQVWVSAKVSSSNYGRPLLFYPDHPLFSPQDDGVVFTIKLIGAESTTIKRDVHCPSWNLPNIQKLVDELVRRHFL